MSDDRSGVFSTTKPFVTAQWRGLLNIAYRCPRRLLEPFVPTGTTLDLRDGEPLLSVTGYMVLGIRIKGIALPFHRDFESVDLRFYVQRRMTDGSIRSGVVLLSRLLPHRTIAAPARWLYSEPYRVARMDHSVVLLDDAGGSLEYSWTIGGARQLLSSHVLGPPRPVTPESLPAFLTERAWGYARRDGGSTLEYQIDHPTWSIWNAEDAALRGRTDTTFGADFAEVLRSPPHAAFVALGSVVGLSRGTPLF
jgi:uncharacterized protein YqjF (DUF2071 family)